MQDVDGKLNVLFSLQELHSKIINTFQQQFGLNFWKKQLKCWIAASDIYGDEHCTVQKANHI